MRAVSAGQQGYLRNPDQALAPVKPDVVAAFVLILAAHLCECERRGANEHAADEGSEKHCRHEHPIPPVPAPSGRQGSIVAIYEWAVTTRDAVCGMTRGSASLSVNRAAKRTPMRVIQHTLIMVILSGIYLILRISFLRLGISTLNSRALDGFERRWHCIKHAGEFHRGLEPLPIPYRSGPAGPFHETQLTTTDLKPS